MSLTMEPRPEPVFSPSQTTDWLEDPTAWYLSRVEGWKPKYLGKKDVAGMLGTAFADGIAVYNNIAIERPEAMADHTLREFHIKSAAQVAEQRARDDMAKVVAEGRSVYEDEAPSWDALPVRAASLVIKYCLDEPITIPSTWKLTHAELVLPNHGYARLDAGYETPLGPAVIDYKTKVTLDAKYESKTLAEFQYAWQMMHYAWAYGEYLGQRVRHFAIIMPILEPKKRATVFHPVVIEPEIMQIWTASAKRVWKLMEAMRTNTPCTFDGQPWCTFRFFTKFGKTDWAVAITEDKLDPILMRQHYVRKEHAD